MSKRCLEDLAGFGKASRYGLRLLILGPLRGARAAQPRTGVSGWSRDCGRPQPPPQIRTCGVTASGSHLGYDAERTRNRMAPPHDVLAPRVARTYPAQCPACVTLHEFPLVSPLPSIASAARVAALFGDFVGTMELSDFPRPFIIGYVLRLPDALCRHLRDRGPWDLPVPAQGVSIHAPGLATARGPSAPCLGGAAGVAFRYPRQRRHPEVTRLAAGRQFRGSIPGLYVPRSTLRPRPCGRRRMTWGRCGWLRLHRMTLSFTPPCRFLPAHRALSNQSVHVRVSMEPSTTVRSGRKWSVSCAAADLGSGRGVKGVQLAGLISPANPGIPFVW